MAADGKQLEALVAFVEKTLLPEGFTVTTNKRVFNKKRTQIAEFDIEIRGKVGSTEIKWLIECRDRPRSGSAPTSWIEQLVGRRTRFGFNKVTAVSTTGFAADAIKYALVQGIEIREVKALAPEEFADWFVIRHIQRVERGYALVHANFQYDESESEEIKRALKELLSRKNMNDAFLKTSGNGIMYTPVNAFYHAIEEAGGLFDDVVVNGPEKNIKLTMKYTDKAHFIIETTEGQVSVKAIIFDGILRIRETLVPLLMTAEYRQADTGEVISQVASFAPQSFMDIEFTTEYHKMSATGEKYLVIRRVPKSTGHDKEPKVPE